MKSYACFARYYDALTTNVEYEDRADYIISLLKHFGHSPGTVLDLACGTGTLTLALKKRGFDIFGVDASEEMLTEAFSKANEAGENILFLYQRMQYLILPQTVDTVLCTLDSINHIASEDILKKAFSRISKYLTDDGLFIFDANTVYKHREILGENCFIYDTDEVFCAWQNEYDESDNTVYITLDFFEPKGNSYQRSTEQFNERAYTHDEMDEMLSSAGLEILAIFDDMSFSPPTETSQREIYIVRKRKNGT